MDPALLIPFLHYVQAGSIERACQTHGYSRSTLVRRIAAAERVSGGRLFERQGVLSERGKDLLQLAKRVQEELVHYERRVKGRDRKVSGAIRIALLDALADVVVTPALPDLLARFPNIDVILYTSYDLANLDRDEADIAVRASPSPPPDWYGQRVSSCAFAA